MLNLDTLRSFADELSKVAFVPKVATTPPARVLDARAISLLGGGAVLGGVGLYGGKRLIDDVRTGEQIRKSQQGY